MNSTEARRNWRHQPLQEIDPSERVVNHGRPNGIGACSRRAAGCGERADKGRIEVSRGKTRAERALELIAGDHLGDFEKDWHIRVAELDDVEEGLLLPGMPIALP